MPARHDAPSFLSNLSSVWAHTDTAPYTATFTHSIPGPARGVVADCLWYPPSLAQAGSSRAATTTATTDEWNVLDDASGHSEADPDEEDEMLEPRVSVMLFIPGNPGLISFYQNFLDTIHRAHPSLGILVHAHLGHAPRLKQLPGGSGRISLASAALDVQVDSAIEAYDALVDEYRDVGGCKVVLCGHSIGAWVALQVMKARPNAVDGAFLLFPAMSDMASTPNGRQLRLIFTPPAALILAALSYLLFVLLLPAPLLLSLITRTHAHWPRHQMYVLRSFLRSPRAIYSALGMSRGEMQVVRSLESTGVAQVLANEARKVWAYYGDGDRWVPESAGRAVYTILRAGGGARARGEAVGEVEKGKSRFQTRRRRWRETETVCGEVVFGTGVPHDFCINHDVIIAQLCSQWLTDGGLVLPSS